MQLRAHAAGLEHMVEVAEQAVGNVDRAGGDAAQAKPQAHPRRGLVHARLQRRQRIAGQCPFASAMAQRQARVAGGAADPQLVAGTCPAAAQGETRADQAHDRDAHIQRPLRRISAHEFDVVGVRQGEQSGAEAGEPDGVGGRKGQCQRERQRLRPHGGEVRQIHRQRLVAKLERIGSRQEMPALEQHVGRDGQLPAGRDVQQGAVIPHAEHSAARGAGEIAGDEIEFAEGGSHIPIVAACVHADARAHVAVIGPAGS
ncbi:hypothetical protein GALL_329270 [mine drainage metagenome]|uniref:Uncharacterized protein n=1 Tax=mine drainage metagenome TaxID=410659 RepID=A0A1J5QZU3_9ZZZZ